MIDYTPLIRWGAIAVFVALAFGGVSKCSYTAGRDKVQAQWDASIERGKAKVAELQAKAGQVTERTVTQYVDRVVTIEGKTREIVRQVPVFVPAGACVLPGSFRLFHDAAAAGAVPDPAGVADAAPVDAQDVAATVADNYGTCHQTAARLTALQDWVAGQQENNP